MNVNKFKTFLIKYGAEILDQTNCYEVVRFKTINGISVVYKGKKGYTFTGESEEAYRLMQKGRVWSIRSIKQKEREKAKKSIIARDGKSCCYCSKQLNDDEITIEHFHSVSDGGSNDIGNLGVCCLSCNQEVGSMPVRYKMEYAIRKRLENG